MRQVPASCDVDVEQNSTKFVSSTWTFSDANCTAVTYFESSCPHRLSALRCLLFLAVIRIRLGYWIRLDASRRRCRDVGPLHRQSCVYEDEWRTLCCAPSQPRGRRSSRLSLLDLRTATGDLPCTGTRFARMPGGVGNEKRSREATIRHLATLAEDPPAKSRERRNLQWVWNSTADQIATVGCTAPFGRFHSGGFA